jgi:hypothetical protein
MPLFDKIQANACLHGFPVIYHALHEHFWFSRSTVCLLVLFQSSSSVTSANVSSLLATLTTFRFLLTILSSFITPGNIPSPISLPSFFLRYLFSIMSSLTPSTNSCSNRPLRDLIWLLKLLETLLVRSSHLIALEKPALYQILLWYSSRYLIASGAQSAILLMCHLNRRSV